MHRLVHRLLALLLPALPFPALPLPAVVLTASVLAAAAVAPGVPHAHAQEERDPVLVVQLHGGSVQVQTASPRPPVVVLRDAQGYELVRREEGQRGAEGWTVELLREADPEGEPPVLVRPGHELSVTMDGQTTTLRVPEMTAEVDAAADTVTGRAPGAQGVAAFVGWQEELFGEGPGLEPIFAPVDAQGRYQVELEDVFDLRPGTFGQIAMQTADGHLLLMPFSPPFVAIDHQAFFALVRAAGNRRIELSTRGPSGAERGRSGRAIEYGGGLYAVILVRGGDGEDAFLPRPGETLVLEVDGQEVIAEEVPWVTGTVDGQVHTVSGLAPPEARVAVEVALADGRRARGRVVADDQGSYVADFTELGVELGLEATVQAFPGQALVHTIRARAPRMVAQLYGGRVAGALAGWGELVVEHEPAGGGTTRRAVVEADPGGSFEAVLYDGPRLASFAAGDLLRLSPERGRTLELRVPELTARPSEDRLRLEGTAPAEAALQAQVYGRDPDIFGRDVFDARYVTREGRSNADGTFSLSCPEANPACRFRFGTLQARQGAVDWSLQWMEESQAIVAVSEANVLGRATAGLSVALELRSPDGVDLGRRTSVSRPQRGGALPGWEVPVNDLWPERIPVGARLAITVGDQARQEVVPALTWESDTRANAVRGTGPALRPMLVLAVSPEADNRGNAAVGATIGLDGRFEIDLGGFDFRPGDDLYLYVLGEEGSILRWYEPSVRGNDPTPTPRPSPTPVPEPRAAYLPWGMR